MNCPLPIDWLELLESGDEGSLEEHLSTCPSCRSIVESLRKSGSDGQLSSDWLSTVELSTSPRWVLSDPDEVRAGQIWLTRESFQINAVSYSNIDRVFVLVLDGPAEQFNWEWIDVAPLLTDTDSATSTDLLLNAEHTTLGVPLAAYFRYQTTLMRNQLDACIGELTHAGEEVLQSVKVGNFDEARFGALLESASDIRLANTETLRHVIERLAAVYPAIEAEALADAEHNPASTEVPAFGAIESAFDAFAKHVTDFIELKRARPPTTQRYPTQLAAASEEVGDPLAVYFSGAKDDLELAGWLTFSTEHAPPDLRFSFETLRGFESHAHVVVLVFTSEGESLASPAIEPRPGEWVVVARGEPVLPTDVETVKVKLGE